MNWTNKLLPLYQFIMGVFFLAWFGELTGQNQFCIKIHFLGLTFIRGKLIVNWVGQTALATFFPNSGFQIGIWYLNIFSL